MNRQQANRIAILFLVAVVIITLIQLRPKPILEFKDGDLITIDGVEFTIQIGMGSYVSGWQSLQLMFLPSIYFEFNESSLFVIDAQLISGDGLTCDLMAYKQEKGAAFYSSQFLIFYRFMADLDTWTNPYYEFQATVQFLDNVFYVSTTFSQYR